MNVYDKSHELAAAIKASQEFKELDTLKKAVNTKPEIDQMIKDFQSKQFEVQAKQMMGEDISQDAAQGMQQIYEIIMKDPLAAQYMQAEMRFSLMIQDVYNILGDAIGIGIGK